MLKNIKVFLLNPRSLFLDNIGTRQTVFKNTFWLALADGVTSLLRFVLIIYAARVLGAAGYGEFAFSLSFVSLFAILSDLGISSIVTRDFAREKENEKEYPVIISAKIFLSVLALILTFIGSFFISQDFAIQKIIWVLMAFFFIDGFFSIIYSFVRARQKMEYEALIKITETVLTVLIGLFIIFWFPSAINLSYAYLVASAIVLTGAALFFHFFVYFLKLNFNISSFKKIVKNAWPLSLGFVGMWIYINIDSTMIGFFGHASEVGWYNASSRIAVSIMTVSGTLISGSFYPLLSRSFSESKAKLQKGWNYYMEIMIILAIPLMFGGIILANQIIGFFYGLENYGPSVFVFQALLIVTGISFLYYPYAMILIVAGNQKKNFLIIFLGATLNIILNLVLVPKFGFYAAAVSTVAVTALALILVIPLSKRYASISIFNLRLFKVLIAAIFSSLLMAMIIKRFAFYNLGIIAITASGAFIYFISLLFLYRVFLKSDFFTRVYTSGKPR